MVLFLAIYRSPFLVSLVLIETEERGLDKCLWIQKKQDLLMSCDLIYVYNLENTLLQKTNRKLQLELKNQNVPDLFFSKYIFLKSLLHTFFVLFIIIFTSGKKLHAL